MSCTCHCNVGCAEIIVAPFARQHITRKVRNAHEPVFIRRRNLVALGLGQLVGERSHRASDARGRQSSGSEGRSGLL